MNRCILALVSSFVVVGVTGCSIDVPEEESDPDSQATKRAGTASEEEDIKSGRSATDPSSKTKSEPSAKLTYKGPFVIGDGTGETGDAQCFKALSIDKPPTTGHKTFKIELQAGVTELQVSAVKLCGGTDSDAGSVLLLKDGATIAKSKLDFGASPDIVTDASVSFGAKDEAKGFEAGEYEIVLAAKEAYNSGVAGAFDDFGVGTLEVSAIGGTGKIMKVGEPSTAPRAEVGWAEAFSVGDNKLEVTEDEACRSSLKAGPATSREKRFVVEIGDGVTDLVFRLDKACGGTGVYSSDVRVYEGDDLLLAKNRVAYGYDYAVITSAFHVNAGNAGRKLAAGKYTFEIAAGKNDFDVAKAGADNDVSVAGVTAWVIGEGATIKKL